MNPSLPNEPQSSNPDMGNPDSGNEKSILSERNDSTESLPSPADQPQIIHPQEPTGQDNGNLGISDTPTTINNPLVITPQNVNGQVTTQAPITTPTNGASTV